MEGISTFVSLAATGLSAEDVLGQLLRIFYFNVLPILLLAGLGFALQRILGLDMPTLTRLNFYFVIPALIYFSVVTSEVTAERAARVIVFAVLLVLALGAVSYVAAWLRRVPRDQRSTLMMTVMFHNSGNYGMPLQEFAFRSSGRGGAAQAIQVFVMITQNFLGFTLGVILAAAGRSEHWKKNLLHVVKFPPLYALAAGIVTVHVRGALGENARAVAEALGPIWETVVTVRSAFLALALCTLGAQLALVPRRGKRYPVRLSVLGRLLVGPTIGLGMVYAMGIDDPFLAQVLLISTSTPTAVNCMLLCLEFDNHPDYAAKAVFYSTLLSPLTVTLVIFLAQSGMLPGFQESPPAATSTKPQPGDERMNRKTAVSIRGDEFWINGRPTYQGRRYKGLKIEGLLMNARLVQGIFDDRNPRIRGRWDYPDGQWDPERNTREFIEAMPAWREHGLVGFTINLQGGSPTGYSKDQPWHNSGIEEDGSLRADYLRRLEQILDRADELGMAPILGIFYFGQEWRLRDEGAVVRAVENVTAWILDKGYTNVLVEIANEVNLTDRYRHDIVKAKRCDELIDLVKKRSSGAKHLPAGRLLVSTSTSGGAIPPESIVEAADFLLLHGNGVSDPKRIRRMVDDCRALATHRGQPILFNEDDHFDFDAEDNNMLASVSRYAGWGYFDYRMEGEGFDEGYQSVPVNWTISSKRKRGFFDLLAEVTGSRRSHGE